MMIRGVLPGRRARRAPGAAMAVVVLALLVWASPASPAERETVRVLDTFDDLAPWTAGGSDGVQASIHPAEGVGGRALRLDFDLGGTAGYAVARRALALELPRRYEIVFYLRADAPVNNFQLKLVDASGDNVWWVNRADFEFPRQWQLVRIKTRHIAFAWGPTGDRTLRRAACLRMKCSASSGMSSGRSRSGGMWIGITLRR